MFCNCKEIQEVAEEKAGKVREVLYFSRGLERRSSQGASWFVQTVKRQDLTRRHRSDEQAQKGMSGSNHGQNRGEKRKRSRSMQKQI